MEKNLTFIASLISSCMSSYNLATFKFQLISVVVSNNVKPKVSKSNWGCYDYFKIET